MANVIEQLDAKIAELLASWNIYTTLLAVVVAAFVAYPLIFWEEPDTHPLLLARQAQPSPVRHPGESAVYRSIEVPHGYPLKTGLGVKAPDAPKWTAGKDGDLRDVWREATRGGGLILTVRGKDAAVEHDFASVTKAIAVIGSHLQRAGVKKVAVYLPNSVEYLATIFACAFYGLSPVLLPYNQPHDAIYEMLNAAGADALIAGAGSVPLASLCSSVQGLRQLVWSVEETSRQMDWNSGSEETNGKIAVSVWHQLVQGASEESSLTLPGNDDGMTPGSVATFWQVKPGSKARLVEFSQKNMVSALGALISALPLRQRIGPSDLVLPADTFSNSYVLCLTLAALFSHSSVAITSVAGAGVDLELASRSVSPTVVIASAETLASLHGKELGSITNGLQKIAHVSQASAMQAGRMPADTLLFKLMAPKGSAVGNTPGQLRLLFVSERAGADSPALSSTMLSDLRIFTRARICYALTAAPVAGAVAQTNMYDYRTDSKTAHSHFGAPLSSLEVKLKNDDESMLSGSTPTGDIVVIGPAVAGGQANLGVRGQFRPDCTLAYA